MSSPVSQNSPCYEGSKQKSTKTLQMMSSTYRVFEFKELVTSLILSSMYLLPCPSFSSRPGLLRHHPPPSALEPVPCSPWAASVSVRTHLIIHTRNRKYDPISLIFEVTHIFSLVPSLMQIIVAKIQYCLKQPLAIPILPLGRPPSLPVANQRVVYFRCLRQVWQEAKNLGQSSDF